MTIVDEIDADDGHIVTFEPNFCKKYNPVFLTTPVKEKNPKLLIHS